jgi:hypothetical protein
MSKNRRKAASRSDPPRAAPPRAAEPEDAGDPRAGLLRTLVLGLLLARWLIPTEAAPGGDSLWLVQLVFAGVILWAWSCLRSSTFELRWGLFDWALWTLVAAHALSAVFVFTGGGDRRTALNIVWEWIGLGATFFLVRQTIQTALDARRLAAIVVALAVVLGGFGIWQHYVFYKMAVREYVEIINEIETLEKHPGTDPHRLGQLQLKLETQGIPTDETGRRQYVNRLEFSNEALGPYALANTFAGFLLVTLMLAGELFRTLHGPRSKAMIAAWSAAFVIVLYCLILTKSRTAWTGLIVAGGLWGVIVLARQRQWFTRRTALGIGLGAAGVVLLFAIAAVGKGFDAEVISEAPKSLSYRLQYWQGAARTLVDTPVFGTGPGNFRQHYLKHKVAESSEEIADPHNWLLDLWANGGILAVAAFLACVVLALVPFWKRPPADDPARGGDSSTLPPWTADLAGPILGFLFAFLAPVAGASGTFEVAPLVLLVSWIVCFAILRRGLGSNRVAGFALGAAALGLMIHLSGAGGIEMPAVVQLLLVLAAMGFTLLNRPMAQASPGVVIAIGGAGVVLFVALFLTGTLPVLNRRAAVVSGEQALMLDGRFDEAEGYFLRAANHDPLSPEPHDKLADTLFARWQSSPPGLGNDYFAKAEQALREAIHQDPLNPTRYRRLGEFFVARFGRSHDPADAESAAHAFEDAVNRYPTDATLRSFWASALADSGQPAEARSQAQQALDLDQINHKWGHTDRYLSDAAVAHLRHLTAGK